MAGKPVRHCLALTLAAFLAVVCGGALPLTASAPAGDHLEAAYITALGGDVQVYRASWRRWVTAFPDLRLVVKDEVKTGPGSFAEISFGTAAAVRLEEKTHIIINRDVFPSAPAVPASSSERSSAASPSPVFQIRAGTVFVQVAKGFARLFDFSVETPTAIAGVRGTIFVIRIGPAGTTTIAVYDGVVAVRAENEEVVLQAGEATVVEPGAPPQPPRRDVPAVPEEKITRWLTRRAEEIRQRLGRLLTEDEHEPKWSAEGTADHPDGSGVDKQRERLEMELEEIENVLTEQLGLASENHHEETSGSPEQPSKHQEPARKKDRVENDNDDRAAAGVDTSRNNPVPIDTGLHSEVQIDIDLHDGTSMEIDPHKDETGPEDPGLGPDANKGGGGNAAP